MYLKHLNLQNFRNYTKSEFNFGNRTVIIGPNTSGKTNLIEAITLLSNGKSFRAQNDTQMLKFGTEVGKVKGNVSETELEVTLTNGEVNGEKTQTKKFLVNGVSKTRLNFIGHIPSVCFSPTDIEIIIGSPGTRRNFLDEVLEQVDFDYRSSLSEYTKGIRQRNSLLELTRKQLHKDLKQFEYWDNLVIKHGNVVTKKRQEFIDFLNNGQKDIFDFAVVYDKSIISEERLLQYQEEEKIVGVTLVGPHRDDVKFEMYDDETKTVHEIKSFGSRGQQRLAVLQLKLLELSFMEETHSAGSAGSLQASSGQEKNQSPLLLLDDVFSELDEGHINLVLEMLGDRDMILTTTHREFIPENIISDFEVIELSKK